MHEAERAGPRERVDLGAAAGGESPTPHRALERIGGSEASLRVLLHELASLIDGSTRYVRLARSALEVGDDREERAARLLGSALGGLERLAGVVSRSGPLGGREAAMGWIGEAFGAQPVHQAIDAAVEHLAPLATSRGVEIETVIQTDVLTAGPMSLYPVLANAVRNAIEASPEGGTVEVLAWVEPLPIEEGDADDAHDEAAPQGGDAATSEPPHALIVEVRNPAESHAPSDRAALDRAFDLGFTTKSGGAGIGLAIARDLVLAAKGSVRLSHDEEANKTVLRVWMPIEPPGAETERWIG